jgi:hypothetical protein
LLEDCKLIQIILFRIKIFKDLCENLIHQPHKMLLHFFICAK